MDFGIPFIADQVSRKRYSEAETFLELVHLFNDKSNIEMAYGLDTDSFKKALYRMAIQRVFPEKCYPTIAVNFLGANKELRDLVELLDQYRIRASTANQGVIEHLNPPSAQRFDGVYEAIIEGAKRTAHASWATLVSLMES